ncbi:MAG: hypothetical protein WDO18_19145 [Acidobacteriota bacterium]
MKKRGVEILANDRVTAATSDKAVLKTGAAIPCKTLASTVPAAVPPVLQKLECAKDKGRLQANSKFELAGTKDRYGPWAIARRPAPRRGIRCLPQRSMRPARRSWSRTIIAAAMRGGEAQAFTFEGLGKLASLGHYSAIAEIMGVRLSGFPAWVLWRTIYLMKMPGLNRKVRIGLDWLVALLFPPDLVQIKGVERGGHRPATFRCR